jgi:hypothetical protein
MKFKSIVFYSEKSKQDLISKYSIAIVGFAGLIILAMLFYPNKFTYINTNLNQVTNMISLFSLLFALCALIIALLAYRASGLRPRLKLQVTPYLHTDSSQVEMFVDLSGEVSLGRPHNEWSIILKNEGDVSAKFSMVRMHFEGAFFLEDSFKGWQAIDHVYTKGYYGYQWVYNDSSNLYPSFAVRLPTIDFSGKKLGGKILDQSCFDFSVIFTFVADGVPTTKLTIPVKVHNSIH